MKFDPWKCPQCGDMPKGTVDTIPGIALLMDDESESGGFEYEGETQVDWDGQCTVTDDAGRVQLVCFDGHTWYAVLTDDDGASVRRTGDAA